MSTNVHNHIKVLVRVLRRRRASFAHPIKPNRYMSISLVPAPLYLYTICKDCRCFASSVPMLGHKSRSMYSGMTSGLFEGATFIHKRTWTSHCRHTETTGRTGLSLSFNQAISSFNVFSACSLTGPRVSHCNKSVLGKPTCWICRISRARQLQTCQKRAFNPLGPCST